MKGANTFYQFTKQLHLASRPFHMYRVKVRNVDNKNASASLLFYARIHGLCE